MPGGDIVGIVGAGQLARMLCESASSLGLHVVVLAEHAGDAAALVAPEVVVGSPSDEQAIRKLASRCEVVTFDHEQVDLAVLARLEGEGVVLRPGVGTQAIAVDKREMRRRFDAAGIPVPAYRVLETPDPLAIEAFAACHGWPVVVKAARGGYDGKGVWPVHGARESRDVCARAERTGTPLLVEAHVDIETELAVVVARRPGGECALWPAVETAQIEGVCREVLYPGGLDPSVGRKAEALAREVSEVARAVGVLAVELFWSEGQLLVNEIAARPHNSAHWTIEGATTSQFENHLRAVLDLPLGDTTPTAAHVASVNVFGAPEPQNGPDAPGALEAALGVPGAHVHLYGKAARQGRKLGHVTVCGSSPRDVRARAWAAAQSLGTPVPVTAKAADR